MANVYVNNAQNRKLGRVGMPRGSMPVSADGTYSPAKTYVDNSFNRRHDRVGLRHGSMVVPKENDSAYRLGRKYNDSGIDVSHTLNDSGIDVSHHSPDTYYSIIESSTNLHLKVIVQIVLESYSHTSRYKLYIKTPCVLLVLQFTSPLN